MAPLSPTILAKVPAIDKELEAAGLFKQGNDTPEVDYPQKEGVLASILMRSMKEVKDEKLKKEVIDYIIRIYNSESFVGILNPLQYQETLELSISGLFHMCYISNYISAVEERDPVFESSVALLIALSTRALNGRDYELRMAEIRSRTPMNFYGPR